MAKTANLRLNRVVHVYGINQFVSIKGGHVKLKKRFIGSVVAGLIAVVALTAASVGSAKTDSAAAPTKATATTATLKIGLVTDIGGLNDRGFNHLAFVGLQRAQKQLGAQGRVFESKSSADYVPNLSKFVALKYDLIIGVGFLMSDAVDTVATKFPKAKFAIIDVDQTFMKHKPKNVQGLLFKEQEVGYLAGYLAALAEKARPGKDVISSVGGLKIPPVDRFIAGYRAGAKKANPKIVTLNAYSQEFVDQTKCKEVALDQIANGSGVIFQVAGGCGLGALVAAKENKLWGIGVDADQGFLGKHILTSAQKKVDNAVFFSARAVKDGTWKSGSNTVFGLKEGGVGLGKISVNARPAWKKAVAAIQAQIISGKIKNIPTTVK